MIFGHISQIDKQALSAPIIKALNFIANCNLDSLELGRYDIDGEQIFANVMSFDTAREETKLAEVHKQYIDLQFLISGKEKIQFALASEHHIAETEYDVSDDFYLLNTIYSPSELVLEPGNFAVFFPEQPHKPGCCLEHSQQIKKVVVKIHKDLLI